jgi:hypothetical protein
MTVADRLFAELDRAIEDAFEVKVESLPQKYKVAKRPTRTLRSIANQARGRKKAPSADPMEVSCKFDKDGNITKGTSARRAIIARYASQVANAGEITFRTCQDELIFRKEVEFAAMLVKDGIVPLEFFTE